MYRCKFCNKLQKTRLSKGYCTSCYQYFVVFDHQVFEPSCYGSISVVTDKNSNQFGWPICHICGKAFVKLQQHIYYSHNLTKNEYCDKFGINHNARLTADDYHNKMSYHAYKNDMDVQLINTGESTRFKPNDSSNGRYKRSKQCLDALSQRFKNINKGAKSND